MFRNYGVWVDKYVVCLDNYGVWVKIYNIKVCGCDEGVNNMSWNMFRWIGYMNKGNVIYEYMFFKLVVYDSNVRGDIMVYV